MANFDIQLITQADHPELIAFWKSCDGIFVGDSDAADKFALYLARNPHSNFLARSEGQIIGTALAGHDGRRGTLRHVAVGTKHRGLGLGRILIERCLNQLAVEGVQRNYVIVLADNEDGLEFWKHNGWEKLEDCVLFAMGRVS